MHKTKYNIVILLNLILFIIILLIHKKRFSGAILIFNYKFNIKFNNLT